MGAGADWEGNIKGLNGIRYTADAEIKGQGEGVIKQWRGVVPVSKAYKDS